MNLAAALALPYGVIAYGMSLAVLVYFIGFVGDIPWLAKTIDRGTTSPPAEALIVDIALLFLFALQHSVMARRRFKAWWTRFVPRAIERSTYVLAAALMLALLMWQWRPIAGLTIWETGQPWSDRMLHALFWVGWGVALTSTFLINHFELFGLQQVWASATGLTPAPPVFRTPLFYRHVRHPLYVGFLLAFWSTPRMSAGHFVFALGLSAYILAGIWFEERDLVLQLGHSYRHYRETVGMLWPKLGSSCPQHRTPKDDVRAGRL